MRLYSLCSKAGIKMDYIKTIVLIQNSALPLDDI